MAKWVENVNIWWKIVCMLDICFFFSCIFVRFFCTKLVLHSLSPKNVHFLLKCKIGLRVLGSTPWVHSKVISCCYNLRAGEIRDECLPSTSIFGSKYPWKYLFRVKKNHSTHVKKNSNNKKELKHKFFVTTVGNLHTTQNNDSFPSTMVNVIHFLHLW